MSRIRTIKPEFQQSESMGRVSRDARLLFVQLWTYADDAGRARAASRMLASVLFPFDDDAPGLIGGWLDELEREDCIQRYEVEGTSYLQIVNWSKHQRVDKPTPSKIPELPDKFANIREASNTIREVSIQEVDLVPSTRTIGEANASLVGDNAADAKVLEFDRTPTEKRQALAQVGSWWNELASSLALPQIDAIKAGTAREKSAWARCREAIDADGELSPLLRRLETKIRGSPFLMGQKGGFTLSFDWLMTYSNFQKVLDGNYENRQAQRR